MNICVHPAFCYVFQHLALITIKAQNRLFSQNILDKISEKPSVYAALKLLVLLYLIHPPDGRYQLLSYISISFNIQITLLVSVNSRRLYRPNLLFRLGVVK